ncbi:MAG: biopolymer transporter ExbD [Chitinophagales bacterium]|nr:biopolymer transporter ExbD [Bacteroidota bacterium]MCB9044197.1 biopolymer transporter ExbD [Chitinophagales bacterium]
MAKSKTRKAPEINASSMADIAFLLLIFFLVTTTMNIDKGILVTLPPYDPNQEETKVDINQRNVLEILVNFKDQLLVEGEPLEITELRTLTKKFVNNNGIDPEMSENPKKAVVSMKNDKSTTYNRYIEVYNEVRAAYNELRDEYAQQQFGRKYDNLTEDQQKTVRDEYPLRLSEAEPEDYGNAKK